MIDNTYDRSDTNIQGYEVCYFRNICNEIIPYPVDGLDYLPISNGHYYIAQEDLILYTTVKGEYNLCPIPYTIDTINNKVIPKDPKYKKFPMYYGSRNQFIYKRIPIKTKVGSMPLPYAFRSGYNPNNYFVFLNGRLMNSAFYKILIPDLTNNLIDIKRIYFTKKLTPDDTLDIFYISNNSFHRMNGSGDLIVRPFKIKATEPIQRKFLIPLPYKDYPLDDYNSFMVMAHGIRLSTDKYLITNEEDKYYIELLDVDEYLIYDDDLVFLFPYYRAEWETSDSLSKTNVLNFITSYKTVEDPTDTVVFDATSMGDINNTNFIYVFEGTNLLDKTDYKIISPNTMKFNHVIPDGTEVAVVIEADRHNIDENNTFTNYVNLPVSTDGQWSLQLPFSDNPKTYIFFRKGKVIPRSHYSIIENQLILGRNYNDLQAGETITAIYTTDGSDNMNNVNFHSFEIKATEADQISIPNHIGLRYTNRNIMVFINEEFISPSRYTIAGNIIKFKTKGLLYKKDDVQIFLLYKTINSLKVPYDISNKDRVQFAEMGMVASEDNQLSFEIPYPNKESSGFTDSPFIVFIRGLFVSDSHYTITEDKVSNKKYIKFDKESYTIKKGDQVDFVFCYTPGYATITKTECIRNLTDGEGNIVNLPYIYMEPVQLYERVLVFYGGTYIDESRYIVDRHKRTITFYDIPYKGDKNREVIIVFFSTASSSSGSVGYIPQSGYIYFNDHQIDRNINNEMLMIFVNGLLVPKANVFDVSNSIKKVTRNLKTRYDLNIINCSPLVTEFKPLYDPENNALKYTVTIKQPANQRIIVRAGKNRIYNTSFNIMAGESVYVEVKADKGYIPGDIKIDDILTYYYSDIQKDITISATEAKPANMVSVKVTQSDNQIVVVTCDGDTFTKDFIAEAGKSFEVKVIGSRDGYIPGSPSVSNGMIRDGLSISASPATVKTFTLSIIDKNLNDQSIKVFITDPITKKTSEYNAPCSVHNIKFGSKFRFLGKSSSGYRCHNNIGPFIFNKVYIADYKYPLDNIIPYPVIKIEYFTVKLYPSVNQRLYMYTWSDYADTPRVSHVADAATDIVEFKVAKGDSYQLAIEADYGYIAGNINVSTGELAGTVESDINVYAEEAVLRLPNMIIKRDPLTASIYSIQIAMNDGFQDMTEGIYSIRPGSIYTAKSILHREVIYKYNGTMSDKDTIITLMPDGTIDVFEEDESE